MTAPARFRQADVTRAIRAAQAAGVPSPKVEIEPSGKIVIYTESRPANDDGPNPWDEDDEA